MAFDKRWTVDFNLKDIHFFIFNQKKRSLKITFRFFISCGYLEHAG